MLRFGLILCLVVGSLAKKGGTESKSKQNAMKASFGKKLGVLQTLNRTTQNRIIQNNITQNRKTFNHTIQNLTSLDQKKNVLAKLDVLPTQSFKNSTTSSTGTSRIETSTYLTTTRVSTNTTPTPSTNAEQCSSMFGCIDCSTAQVCKPSARGYIRTFKLSCSHSTPYCDYTSGTCSTKQDPKCNRPDSFICPDDGYFPDAIDCNSYHACNDFDSQIYSCPEGHVYDPDTLQCDEGDNCDYIVNCAGFSEKKIAMGDTHFYTYCSSGLPILVARCPGVYKLNSTTQLCEPVCEQDGIIEDLEDNKKFYQCSTLYASNMAVPVRQSISCPPGEVFKASVKHCVSEHLLSSSIKEKP